MSRLLPVASKWWNRMHRPRQAGWSKETDAEYVRRRAESWARLVPRLASEKSFADIGGMWGVHGEVAFWAEEAGASRVVLYDGMDPSTEFQREHQRRRSGVKYVQGDLHDEESVDELGAFDVVWCTGVLYHSPNPFLLLEHLRRLTRETLLIGSHVIPEIRGAEQACVWYPAMGTEAQRRIVDTGNGFVWQSTDQPHQGYANNWWGISRSALRAMILTARFEIVETWDHGPFLTDVLAHPIQRESLIPPTAFARERGARRVDEHADRPPSWL